MTHMQVLSLTLALSIHNKQHTEEMILPNKLRKIEFEKTGWSIFGEM
jgi:hypothetical protein